MNASQARRRARALHEDIGALLETLLARSPLFPASLYEHKSRCGKPTCRCAKGPYRHRLWCLSFVEEGRSRTRVVPKSMRRAVERLTADYRSVRRTRRTFQRLLKGLLAAVDVITAARAGEGNRRYARLVARAMGTAASHASKKRK
jgi:hypothetical protein